MNPFHLPAEDALRANEAIQEAMQVYNSPAWDAIQRAGAQLHDMPVTQLLREQEEAFRFQPAVEETLRAREAARESMRVYESPEWDVIQRANALIQDLPMTQLLREQEVLLRYQPYIDTATRLQRQVDELYAPIRDEVRWFTSAAVEWKDYLRASDALENISRLNLSGAMKIAKTLQVSIPQIGIEEMALSEREFRDYCTEGKITPASVAGTVGEICDEAKKGHLTIPERIDKIKKTNWYFGLTIVLLIFSFLGGPAVERAKDDFLKKTGITQFWEESGAYEWLDGFFRVTPENEKTQAVPEIAEDGEAERQDNTLEYKGYRASISFDAEEGLFVGTVLNAPDSLSFHGKTVEELTSKFHRCVEEYLEYCKETGTEFDGGEAKG